VEECAGHGGSEGRGGGAPGVATLGDLMREHCLQVGFRHGYDNAVEED
jgi:hypothetical protein